MTARKPTPSSGESVSDESTDNENDSESLQDARERAVREHLAAQLDRLSDELHTLSYDARDGPVPVEDVAEEMERVEAELHILRRTADE